MDKNGKLTASDREFGYWNRDKGRIKDFYTSDEVREAIGDLLVNVRELNRTVDALKKELAEVREDLYQHKLRSY